MTDEAYGDRMGSTPRAVTLAAVVTLVAITACGGGDDTTSTDDRPTTSEPAASEGVQADDDDTETAGTGDAATEDAGTTDSSDAEVESDDPSGGDLTCDDIFGASEIEAWFGEPAEMTEETTDSIGQLVCTWETIEDPENLDDLAVSIVVAQVFSGDPVPAENFIDPDIFDDVTMLDGFGDVAFYTDVGPSFYFYDDPVAGTVTFTHIDMGDADAPALHTNEELEAMFRTFHGRVTG